MYTSKDRVATVLVALAVLALALVYSTARDRQVSASAPATCTDCRTHLETLRVSIREYVSRHGHAPSAPYATRTGIGTTQDYNCPVCGRAYSYDPGQFPGRYVVCTYPEHTSF